MIEIRQLTKVYKLSRKQMQKQRTKQAVRKAADAVSLKASEGEIYGLLGPNGAGKTTILRCVATLLKPTEGCITVNGFDTVREAGQVRSCIGFLTNEIRLDQQFSPKYIFHFFGRLHGMKEEAVRKRREELFHYFGIDEFENKKIKELSTGMKQKAAIAVSLLHDPKIIIFDEPTTGLDIITARSVTDYLKFMRDQGRLVLISTHIMSEAEKLCDRIGILMDGRMAEEGSLAGLLKKTGRNCLEDAFFEIYKANYKEEA